MKSLAFGMAVAAALLAMPAHAAFHLFRIVEIYSNYDFETEVLVASIRHPLHVVEAARIGADISTMPWNVLQGLAKHPLTDKGLELFLADWEKVKSRAK